MRFDGVGQRVEFVCEKVGLQVCRVSTQLCAYDAGEGSSNAHVNYISQSGLLNAPSQ